MIPVLATMLSVALQCSVQCDWPYRKKAVSCCFIIHTDTVLYIFWRFYVALVYHSSIVGLSLIKLNLSINPNQCFSWILTQSIHYFYSNEAFWWHVPLIILEKWCRGGAGEAWLLVHRLWSWERWVCDGEALFIGYDQEKGKSVLVRHYSLAMTKRKVSLCWWGIIHWLWPRER